MCTSRREQTKAGGAELAALLVFHTKKKKKITLKIEKSLIINSAVVKFKANHFTKLLDVEIITAILCSIKRGKKKKGKKAGAVGVWLSTQLMLTEQATASIYQQAQSQGLGNVAEVMYDLRIPCFILE